MSDGRTETNEVTAGMSKAELLAGASEHSFSGVYPGDVATTTEDASRDSVWVFLVVHCDATGEMKFDEFPNSGETERFLERLLEAGVDRANIQTYLASKSEFEISFRPIVHLSITTRTP